MYKYIYINNNKINNNKKKNKYIYKYKYKCLSLIHEQMPIDSFYCVMMAMFVFMEFVIKRRLV